MHRITFVDRVCLKENNKQVRNQYTHTLTYPDTNEVRFTPFALRARDQLYLRIMRIDSGRVNKLKFVIFSGNQQQLIEGLIAGKRRRDRL